MRRQWIICKPRGSLPRTQPCWHLDLALPASWTVRNTVSCLSYPVYYSLLQQPKLRQSLCQGFPNFLTSWYTQKTIIFILPPGARAGLGALAAILPMCLPWGLRALTIPETLVETEDRVFTELQEQVVWLFPCLLTSKDWYMVELSLTPDLLGILWRRGL